MTKTELCFDHFFSFGDSVIVSNFDIQFRISVASRRGYGASA
jgi:hypothetical protein